MDVRWPCFLSSSRSCVAAVYRTACCLHNNSEQVVLIAVRRRWCATARNYFDARNRILVGRDRSGPPLRAAATTTKLPDERWTQANRIWQTGLPLSTKPRASS